MEEIGKKKCPKCGGKYLPKTTANGIIYECESCGYKTIERIGKSFHADYRSRRRSVKLDIERIIDDKFTPTKCPCGTAASKLIEVASLNDGLSYKCPKCGNVQRDEGSKRCLDLLYELGHEFPDESGRDPVYHYLFIQVWTRNFQYWSEKVNQHLSMVEKSSYDKEDEEDVLAYGQSMNGLLFQHAIEIGDIKLCPYCKSNYIKKSAKMCEECEVKREEKQIEKEEKRELNRQYRDSEAGKASAKKKATAALVLLIVAILAATSVIAIYVVAPKLLFGSSTIEYYVDGTRYTAEAVYSKKVSIDKPTKTGHRFLGLYDAEIDGNMVIDPSGKSMTTWQSKEKDVTVKLYPHWETIEYKIKLDVNGGIEGNLVTPNVVYGESMNALPVDVTREGYTFVGWATSADDDALLVSDKTGNLLSGKETLTDNGYVIPDEGDEITLYAKWTYYTVTTTVNISEAGSVSKMNETKVTVGDNVTVMATTNIGYTWIGWYVGNTKLTDELTYTFEMTTKNKTLTAKWTKTEIEKSDNMAGSVSELSSTYKVGDSATVTATTNIGYTWVGWFDGYTKLTDELSYTFVMTEENKTLTAKWIANTYNISYDVNGGSAMASSTDTIQFNSTKTLAVPTKDHYTFEGWYIGNTQITTGNGKMLRNWSIANNDTVLTAKWEVIPPTLRTEFGYDILSCKLDNGYNNTEPSTETSPKFRHDHFSLGKFVLNNANIDGNNIEIADGYNAKLSFVMNYDFNKLPLAGDMTDARISNDNYANNYYNMPYNVDGIKTGYGIAVIEVVYKDGSSSYKKCITNLFSNKMKGQSILLLDNTVLNKDCEVKVTIVYEIQHWAPGFMGISGDYFTNWRIDLKLNFEVI